MHPKDILIFSSGPIAAALIGAITIPILAWFFAVEDIGRLSLFQMLISFSVLFFSFGLDEAYLREFHEAKDKFRLLKTALSPGFLLIFALCLLISVTGFAELPNKIFNLASPSLGMLVLLGVTCAYILRFLTLVIRIREQSEKYAFISMIPKLMQLALLGICIYFYTEFTFIMLALIYVLSNLITLIFAAWFTKTDLVRAIPSKIKYNELKGYIHFGFPLIVAGMGSWALISFDKLFLRAMSTIEELGIYSVAASIAAFVGVVTGIANTLLAPIIYKMAAAGDYSDKMRIILNERMLAAVFFIFVAGGLTNWLVPMIFPDTYKDIDSFILCCVASPLLYTLSEVSSIGINLARKTNLVLVAVSVALIVNSSLNYYLVPVHGAAGAAAATSIAFYVYFVVKVLAANHVSGRVPITKLVIVPLFCLVLIFSEAIFSVTQTMIYRYLWLCMGCIGILIFKGPIFDFKESFQRYVKKKYVQGD